jgi:UDP-N-acetylmuramate dehydrogenase
MIESAIAEQVSLAQFTTLELGGPAEYFVRVSDRAALLDALTWARDRSLPVHVLGGGSNLVIGDHGLPGLTIRIETRGIRTSRAGAGNLVELQVEAGEPWDALVERTVDEDLAGLECLSGIPGLAGATPIQNVGAYGQDVSETIRAVELLDRQSLQLVTCAPDACGFGYRTSAFKAAPDRYVVLGVRFGLREHGPASVKYAELARAVANPQPSLREVREAVLALRRGKSMVIDPSDENRRSAGSFFLNPIVSAEQVRDVAARAVAAGVIQSESELPTFAAHGGTKIPAAWLIERAGFTKGFRRGLAGISSRHALALVNHGGSSEGLLDLARAIRDGVEAKFGVRLHPEPVLLGLRF